jgi:CHAD domain-containing protein
MGAVVRELESKFEPGDGDLPDLTVVEGVVRVADPETLDLQATYFDTDDLALSSAGLTLRRRVGGSDAGWHLKVPSPDGGRYELREPLSGVPDDVVPEALTRAVQRWVRGRALRPVVRIRTRRTVHRLYDEDGRTIAELCDDRVLAENLGDPDAPAPSEWREWEIELVDGEEALLEAAGEALRTTGARPASGPSKLARALGDRVPAGSAVDGTIVGPSSSAAEVVGDRLRQQVAEMAYRDPLVRYDAPDAVHKMRVATRRLRSALASYRRLLDRTTTEPLRDELKWIAGVLGDARDAEVMQDRLAGLIAEEPSELVMGPVEQRVAREFGASYRLAHRRAVEAMESPRYYALVDRLDALVADPPWRPRARKAADDVLPARVAKDFNRLRRRVTAVAEAPDRRTRDARLHEVRKAAKRARYAAEPLVPVVGRDAERFAKATKRLQSVLGDYQDAVVTQPALRRLAVQAHLDGENAFTYGLLHGRQRALAASLRAGFHDAWARAKAKKRRKWLP